MAKYTYDTATGPVEIDTDEHWAALLKAEDICEQNAGRKHMRPDHKYAPGEPVSLDGLQYEGEWFEDRGDEFGAVELSADLERAMRSLTDLQRRYFILNRLKGHSYAEIARREGKHKVTVIGIVEASEKKLKKIFE